MEQIIPKRRFLSKNFEGRRGASRSGGDGVDTYSEPSIAGSNKVFTKIIEIKGQ